MGSVVISGATSGAVTLAVPDEAGTRTLTLPATTGTILTNDISQAGDTSAGNAAAVGYTSAEGLILTGQGSTSDVTIKNDADATVINIPTGTTKVGIGHAAAASTLDVLLAGDGNISGPTSGVWAARVVNEQDSDTYNGLAVQNRWAADSSFILEGAMGWNGSSSGYFPVFTIDGLGQAIFKPQRSEAMRITSAGKVGIGTSAPTRTLTVIGSVGNQFVGSQSQSNDTAKYCTYAGSHYHNSEQDVAGVVVLSNGTDNIVYLGGGVGELNAATNLRFHTGANDATTGGTERMRIRSNGQVLINQTSIIASDNAYLQVTGGSVTPVALRGGTNNYFMAFYKESNNDLIGSITGSSGTATAFNTSSDYRLKENVSYTFDATTRLKQLKPARFNFIADREKGTVDGFLAHEVSSVVPNAITGAKDAVDDDNKPIHQQIDQSKLVPLLVKTIQELEARITALEAG
jgi:hypothetical protein